MANALRCDGCGAYATTEKPSGRYMLDGPLPAGWLRVMVFDRAREDAASVESIERHEVCSRKCAADCLAGVES